MKGTRDILPPESALWNRVEQTARRVFATYGFGEIRLPIFERAELFARAVGRETDIVSKEMYSWVDSPQISAAIKKLRVPFEGVRLTEGDTRKKLKKDFGEMVDKGSFDMLGKRVNIALRPEATASVARAYIENSLYAKSELAKLFYLGPMFRRERPQKGRFRQFYQVGAEVMGQSDHPSIDAEVIEMLIEFISQCGLKEWKLDVNSIGCPGCRPQYVEILRGELQKIKDKLGPDSQRRIETNPLRVFDSKLEDEQGVIAKLPPLLSHLCSVCREHFANVRAELTARSIHYELNSRLVRGLDYYMRTTFEVTAPGLGSQDAICGGGRYDGLVEMLGGPPTKGMGFALGTDRLILALQAAGATGEEVRLDAYVVYLGDAGRNAARSIVHKLRGAGAAVVFQAEERKLSKALDLAAKSGARYAVIIGDNEVKQKKCTLRDLDAGKQESLSEEELLGAVIRS